MFRFSDETSVKIHKPVKINDFLIKAKLPIKVTANKNF